MGCKVADTSHRSVVVVAHHLIEDVDLRFCGEEVAPDFDSTSKVSRMCLAKKRYHLSSSGY